MRPAAILPLAALAAMAVAGCGQERGAREGTERAGALAAPRSAPPDEPPPAVATAATAAGTPGRRGGSDLLRGRAVRLNGEPDDLAQYRGKVVLVVNTASRCINTGQYGELEAMYRTRRADGFVVLGFPANDFAGQEPGTNEEIATFCRRNFGVSFPMFAKAPVTGAGAQPLFRGLAARSAPPTWNFTKYLLDRRGRLSERFDPYLPADAPQVRRAIERLL